MRRLFALALLAMTATGLSGCGNKGALVLPPATPATATSTTAPVAMPAAASTAPAPPTQP